MSYIMYYTRKAKKKKRIGSQAPPHVFFTPRIQFFSTTICKKKIEAVSRKSGFSCPFLSVSILSFIMYIFKAFVYIDMHLSDR